MLTAAPHLHVRRPSPTTAEFTVSTYPPHSTQTLRLLLLLVGLLRLVLALGAGMLLYAEWWTQLNASAASSLYHTPLGRVAQDVAARTPAWVLVPLCLGALFLSVRRIHVEERLLVLRGLGIQTRSTPATILLSWLGSANGGAGPTRFIPTEKIRDVLINEAFWGVRGAGEEGLVVVFPKLLPNRAVVEEVWRGVRGCLFDEGNGGMGEQQLHQQPEKKRRVFKDVDKRRSIEGDKTSPASATEKEGEVQEGS
ncbi:hypothetical protein PG987_013541 [Apiospora arundinis]